MGSMASAAADDVKIGVGLKKDPGLEEQQYTGVATPYQRRTKASVDRMRAPSAADKEDDRPRQPAPARAALPSTTALAQLPLPHLFQIRMPLARLSKPCLTRRKKAAHPRLPPAPRVCCLARMTHANAAASWVD